LIMRRRIRPLIIGLLFWVLLPVSGAADVKPKPYGKNPTLIQIEMDVRAQITKNTADLVREIAQREELSAKEKVELQELVMYNREPDHLSTTVLVVFCVLVLQVILILLWMLHREAGRRSRSGDEAATPVKGIEAVRSKLNGKLEFLLIKQAETASPVVQYELDQEINALQEKLADL
jgi:hypothetical protein